MGAVWQNMLHDELKYEINSARSPCSPYIRVVCLLDLYMWDWFQMSLTESFLPVSQYNICLHDKAR